VKRNFAVVCAVLMIGGSTLTANATKTPRPVKAVQLQKFTVAKDVTVPDKYMQSMMDDIAKQLTNTKQFQALAPLTTDAPAPATQPGILLKGQLLEFNPGSRAARFASANSGWVYLATKGGKKGEAKVRVHIQFIDSQSGQILREDDVEAVIKGNPWDMNPAHAFGQSANATTPKIAKQIAKIAKTNLQ